MLNREVCMNFGFLESLKATKDLTLWRYVLCKKQNGSYAQPVVVKPMTEYKRIQFL